MARTWITENITSLFHNMEQGCKYPICNLLHFFLHRLTFLTLFHFLLGCLLHLGLLILGHPLCLLLITILVFIIIIIIVVVVIITIIVAFLNLPFCWGLFTSTFGILPFLWFGTFSVFLFLTGWFIKSIIIIIFIILFLFSLGWLFSWFNRCFCSLSST